MLTASINFNRDPIFLAGETVQVEVALENESSSDDESMAICTGQLSCRCAVNGNKVNKDLMESQLTQLFSSASPLSGNRSPKSNYEIGSNTAFNIAQVVNILLHMVVDIQYNSVKKKSPTIDSYTLTLFMFYIRFSMKLTDQMANGWVD